jgi:hypothetical protein
MKTSALLVFALAASALMTCAQEPRVTNTQFHSGPVSLGLSATVDRFRHSDRALWVGYAVPALPRTRSSACSPGAGTSDVEDGCCHELWLEEPPNDIKIANAADLPPRTAYVLLRLDQGEIVHVRSSDAGCTLNAGNVAFEWLTGVQAEESAVFLGKLAESSAGARERLTGDSLAALSMHATPRATDVLAGLASDGHDNRLREKAAFWLGAERGHEGLLALHQLMGSQDTKFREKLTFDLSINADPAAMDDLIQLAKTDPDARVRSQALFWLAQKAGKKSLGALNAPIESDPSLEVKKKAVFAISQLPKDESVPQLVHIADTNANFQIRKEAIFWLGQSQDPRALAYIESVLKK